jgi:hypothetical protein
MSFSKTEKSKNKKRFPGENFFLLASITIYIVALIVQHGWRLLIIGGEFLFDGNIFLPWFANPLIFLSWIFFKKVWVSFILSLLAVILSVAFFYTSYKQGVEGVSAIWVSTMVVMATGAIVRIIRNLAK